MSAEEPPHTVTIHVDGSDSEIIGNGHAKSSVEMQPVNVKTDANAAKPDSIIADIGNAPNPSSISPTTGLFNGDAQFPLTIENLQRLFRTETTPDQVREIINNEYGGLPGLMEKLRTDPSGLDAEMCAAMSQSIADRIAMYGYNTLPVKEPTTFWEFCEEVLEDTMLRILLVASLISIALGLVESPKDGWYEGAAILFAVVLVTLVSATNNYQQQSQFAAVDVSKELDPVTVIRSGRQFSVDPTELLVGDLVALSAGQRIPADGVVVQVKGKELKVNESSATGETGLLSKDADHPLLMSGTEVVSGSCVYLVILVGINTSYGQTLASLVEEDRETPLQKKLSAVAQMIGWIGTAFAAMTFAALLGYWIHDVAGHSPSTSEWSELLDIAVVCISIIVVAVPEGLPLAVTVSLAYSMKAMLKDHILVRELAACETMGNATAICSDKTGTLTQNRMTVQRVYLQQQMMERPPPIEDMEPSTLRLLEQSIILNSAAWIEDEHVELSVPPQDWKWKDGNQTEIALLAWLIGYGFDVNRSRAAYAPELKASEPFDSIKKYSSIIIQRSDEEIEDERQNVGVTSGKRYRQYFKGAAEAVISRSDRQVNKFGQPVPLVATGGGSIHKDLLDCVSEFSRRGLRVIAFAYRDLDELPKKREENEEAAEEQPISDAILIGMAGLSDPLRPTSYRSVRLCQRAGIIVRMVTGDHPETARHISRECGIWTSKNHLIMTGAEFRKMMAEADLETKKNAVTRLRVLARSSPQDKQILVKFLQDQGEVVAATGDGTNDAPALKSADVGIAMFQSGTAVCKSAADLWLMDDNFASIVAAVVWGRCVFDNIRKFLGFQLTVNVVALFLSLIGALTEFPLPLTTVQLLWVNLIMDTAAAVSLGTEQPIPEVLLSRTPKSPSVPLVSKVMWFRIIAQSCYQLTVLLFLLYNAQLIFPHITDKESNEKISKEHKTLIFNTFVWMQIGNIFNARRVDMTFNIFQRMFENFYFLAILFGICGMQVLMVEVFGDFANTTHQRGEEWACALVCGVFIWVMNAIYTLMWKLLTSIWPTLNHEIAELPIAADTFEGAHLDDKRYSFKRPDNAEELSVIRQRDRPHSRHSLSHHSSNPAEGAPLPMLPPSSPNAQQPVQQTNARLISSMSARRANPVGSARRVNPVSGVSLHSNDVEQPHGELDVGAVPVAAGPTKEQINASASWPRAPHNQDESNKPLGSHAKTQGGGVQVIEELDELL